MVNEYSVVVSGLLISGYWVVNGWSQEINEWPVGGQSVVQLGLISEWPLGIN